MRFNDFLQISKQAVKALIFKSTSPIVGSIILTDRCNLSCKHCAVNNISKIIYPYDRIMLNMKMLYDLGVRILMLYGGEPFFWHDGSKTIRDLVIEAKIMGFCIVNIVSNGTYPLNIPEADTILVSLDGSRQKHNTIRGNTFDKIMHNIRSCSSKNICLYMAINKVNKDDIFKVGKIAIKEPNVKAISFNFHTPYPGTEYLSLTRSEKRTCCEKILFMMKKRVPVFNLKSAFPYIIENTFPRPARQCIVVENGRTWICGRCIDINGLCGNCGFVFAAEYALAFSGHIRVIWDMLRTYFKYI